MGASPIILKYNGAAHLGADDYIKNDPPFRGMIPSKSGGYFLELMVGIEPTTYALRVRRSAIEPHQHFSKNFYTCCLCVGADYESAALPTELH